MHIQTVLANAQTLNIHNYLSRHSTFRRAIAHSEVSLNVIKHIRFFDNGFGIRTKKNEPDFF